MCGTRADAKRPPSIASLLVAIVCVLRGVGAIDDLLSYKSLVLGSLSSGERVSGRVRSPCLSP